MVGFVAVSISIFIGIIVYLVSGFIGGKVDMMIMRSIDVLMALPTLFLILMVQVFSSQAFLMLWLLLELHPGWEWLE